MIDYQITASYTYIEGGSSQILTLIVSAVNRNDAWLNAVQKLYTMLSGSTGTIRSITLTVYEPPTT